MNRYAWLLIGLFAASVVAACSGRKEEAGNESAGTEASGGRPGAAAASARIDEARARELASIDVPGFRRIGDRATRTMAMPSYEAEVADDNGKRAHVDVVAKSCVGCLPMDVHKWRVNENLKSVLPKIHKDNPDLVWEVEGIEAGGLEGISIYERSFVTADAPKPGDSRHGVIVHYNNGVNQLTLTVTLRGGAPANSAAELAAEISKEALEEVARKFLAVFGPKL